MDLLTENIIESENFSFLCSFFKNPKSNSLIPYETFELYLADFAKEVMKNYIKETPYSSDSCLFLCHDKMDSYGSYNPKFNIIFIRKEIVKKMYKTRDLSSLTVLFHELNHFKFKYDIKLGYFSEDLLRVIKEELISKSPIFPSFIKMLEEDNTSTYYEDNYEFYSEEKLADIASIENLLFFTKKAHIPLNENQKQQINFLINKLSRQYKNYYRDVQNNINFNSYIIDFEEAFDILIKDNPNWLQEYPQLQVEYYIDENRKIVKKSNDELSEMLSTETDKNIIEYINKLLANKEKKNNYIKAKKSVISKKINIKDLSKSNKL